MGSLPEIYFAPTQFAVRRIYQAIIHPTYPQGWTHLKGIVKYIPHAQEIALYGAGMIEGQLTAQGVPASERVMAVSRDGMKVVGMAQSDPITGRWRIYPVVAQRPYAVVGMDSRIRFNAVIADGVVPVAWEEQP